jgi:hypothetical protein
MQCTDVDCPLIREVVEDIACSHSGCAELVDAKDQVQPLMEPRGDVLGLERRTHRPHKLMR